METVLDRLTAFVGFKYDLKGLRRFERASDRVRDRMDSMAGGAARVGAALTTIGAAGAAAFGVAAKSAIDWETATTGVRKTVEATEAQFSTLFNGLRRLAMQRVPLPVEELAGVAEAAGQLGIQTPNILAFTEVMAKLGVTTNLAAGEAATQLARMANVMGTSQTDFDRMGSTIVDLGNNFATTEQEIVSMALRIARGGATVGLTEAQVFGLATALSSIGVQAELGGTAVQRVMIDMFKAVHTGGEDLASFARLAGTDAASFAQSFQKDASGALLQFFTGIDRMQKSGGNALAVLDDLGLSGQRVIGVSLGLAKSQDKVTAAISRGERAWEDNTALNKEASLRFGTAASKIQFLRNRVHDLNLEVGGALVPGLLKAIEQISPLVDRVKEWAAVNPEVIKQLALITAALTVVGGGFLAFATALTGASFALGGIQAAVTTLGKVLGVLQSTAAAVFGGVVRSVQWMGTQVGAAFGFVKAQALASFAGIARAKRRLDLQLAFTGWTGVVGAAFAGMRAAAVRAYAGIRAAALATIAPIRAVFAAVAVHGVFGALRLAAVAAFTAIRFAAIKAAVAAGIAWIAATGGIALVVAAVAALLVAAWTPVSTFFIGLWNGMVAGWDRIKEAGGRLLDALGPIGQGIRAVFEGVGDIWDWLVNLFGSQEDLGEDWGEAIIDGAVKVIDVLTNVVGWIKDVIEWGAKLLGIDFEFEQPDEQEREQTRTAVQTQQRSGKADRRVEMLKRRLTETKDETDDLTHALDKARQTEEASLKNLQTGYSEDRAAQWDQDTAAVEKLEKALQKTKDLHVEIGTEFLPEALEKAEEWRQKVAALPPAVLGMKVEEKVDPLTQDLRTVTQEIELKIKAEAAEKSLEKLKGKIAETKEEEKKLRQEIETAQKAAVSALATRSAADTAETRNAVLKAGMALTEAKEKLGTTEKIRFTLETEDLPRLTREVEKTLQDVDDLLPKSDAKVGPLSNLRASGQALVDTLTQGVRDATPLKVALTAGILSLPPVDQLVDPALAQPLPALEQTVSVQRPGLPGIGPATQQVDPIAGELPAMEPVRTALQWIADALPVLDPVRQQIDPDNTAAPPVPARKDTNTLPAVYAVVGRVEWLNAALPAPQPDQQQVSLPDNGAMIPDKPAAPPVPAHSEPIPPPAVSTVVNRIEWLNAALPALEPLFQEIGLLQGDLPPVEDVVTRVHWLVDMLPALEPIIQRVEMVRGDLAPLGEMIVDMPNLESLGNPLPVGPTPQETTAASNPGPSEVRFVFNDGAIQINVPTGDPEEIAQAVGTVLEEQLRGVVEQVDTQET